jgi:beta-xylosidase
MRDTAAGRHVRATFTNPVYAGYFADPFVLAHGGRYYAYGTGPGDGSERAFEVLGSDDLVAWESLGFAMRAVHGRVVRDHWAPEVIEEDGLFHLYFSVGVDDREHGIRHAVAERPEGPFSPTASVLTPRERFAIDAHPFRDRDGSMYLFYARDELEGSRVGTSLVVDRMTSMDRLGGEPVPVLRASADWQRFRAGREMYGGIYDWHTLEGPFVVHRGGRYWCLYSGGAWTNATYGVSYAVAEHPLGPFVEPESDGPALMRTLPGVLEGPGHASVVTDSEGADFLVYHAWDAAYTARRMCIDRLDWTAAGPRTPGPTIEPQPAPS